jgi:hypothetical protein
MDIPWNSLEIAEPADSAMAPVILMAAGFWVNRYPKRYENLQWSGQKVIDKPL